MTEIIDILDERGNVIGQDTRENIHKNGFLHKEAFVFFYTPEGKVILQRRSKQKETGAGMLDATIGGHVDTGDDFEHTLIRETQEEAGLEIKDADLVHLCTLPQWSRDASRDYTNNALKGYFAYCFTGDVKDLTPQESEVDEFVLLDLGDFPITNEGRLKEFANSTSIENFLPIRKIKDLL